MIDVLDAGGPHPEHADKLMLFGRLVGSWDIEARFLDEEGAVTKKSTGEWHFGWVLEGRAIQAVLITPPLEGRGSDNQSRSYDTTIHTYDPNLDIWRVTVVAPIANLTVNMVARGRGEEIWLEGTSPAGDLWRWTFSEFSDDRVRYQGYVSTDDGQTWFRGEEIILRRRK